MAVKPSGFQSEYSTFTRQALQFSQDCGAFIAFKANQLYHSNADNSMQLATVETINTEPVVCYEFFLYQIPKVIPS